MKDKKTRQSFERDNPFNDRLSDRLTELGLLTRVRNIIGISPPLIVTRNEIDEVVGAIDRALGDTEKELSIS